MNGRVENVRIRHVEIRGFTHLGGLKQDIDLTRYSHNTLYVTCQLLHISQVAPNLQATQMWMTDALHSAGTSESTTIRYSENGDLDLV